MMDWYGDGSGMGTGGWLMMGLFMLPFWALLVLGCVALYRSVVHAAPSGHAVATPSAHHNRALEIVEERYARGEIDADEYTTRREILTGR